MKIAILIPSTTNQRDWNCITETYLYKSIISFVGKYNPDYQYKFYIGVDTDDKIYSVQSHKNKIYELCRELNVGIQFYPIDKNTHKGYLSIIWNTLYKKSIEEKNDYFWVTGDDIIYNSDGWLDNCINALEKTKGIGCSGCFNGNNRILTQFLITKKHYDIFSYCYHPHIKNWGVDDVLHFTYAPAFLNICEGQCINAGGDPRYEIDFSYKQKIESIIKEERDKLFYYINHNGGLQYYLGNQGKATKRKGSRSRKSLKTD